MMLPLCASVLAYVRSQMLLAGVLVGAAILFKYQAGIQPPLYGVALVIAHRRKPVKIPRSAGALLAISAAIPIALAVGWLVHLHAVAGGVVLGSASTVRTSTPAASSRWPSRWRCASGSSRSPRWRCTRVQ